MSRIFPTLTATRLQAATYLLGIALFSIAFLVFLNSSISFVVTYVIGQEHGVGDAVGTLGFADELLALVACPLWGLLSDRIGIRMVAVFGYCIIGLSLICLVQSTNVYPELLLGRLGFSVGGAACSTMVTACLPAMVMPRHESITHVDEDNRATRSASSHASRLRDEEISSGSSMNGHAHTPSVSSELTITQQRWTSRSQTHVPAPPDMVGKGPASSQGSGTSQLAGFVGMFTGVGALLALLVFLPLPAYFQKRGQDQTESQKTAFYVVGVIAFCVAIFIFVGLRGLPGEEHKSLANLFRRAPPESSKTDQEINADREASTNDLSYFSLIAQALRLGFADHSIGLGYLGGFVARASSVGISLFIPLFVNAYFIRTGLCSSRPDNPTDIKEKCHDAYQVAAALTGIAETAALICAPIFGWLGGRVMRDRSEWPLLGASVAGVVAYCMFGALKNPDAFHGHGGGWAFLAVILIGISQIGAIVCSLALLGRGIHYSQTLVGDQKRTLSRPASPAMPRAANDTGPLETAETAPLLPTVQSSSTSQHPNRAHLKGTIAGIYSFIGGAGILLLTKLGGVLFDKWIAGAPFYMLAIFNALLLVALLIIGSKKALFRQGQNTGLTRSESD